MKIVIACDSFKGSLNSMQVGMAIAEGVRGVCPQGEVIVLPMADGGEGTVDAIVAGWKGRMVECEVRGPLGEPVMARYGVSADGVTAIMEMAQASGLTLLPPDRRDPMGSSTFGTGEMVADALQRGCRKIIMGLGGSATCDGGMGMLAALGVRFLNSSGDEVAPCGASLGDVARVDVGNIIPALKESDFIVACDVDNPLCGVNGAARIFAPQKGATREQVEKVEKGLEVYAKAVARATGIDVAALPGSGAAGGLGGAFMAFLHARVRRGVDIVLDSLSFDSHLDGADLVITGEGRMDEQTLGGKAPLGVLTRGVTAGVPVVALCGAVEGAQRLVDAGFTAVLPVVAGPCTLSEAMRPEVAVANIARTAEMLMRLLTL